MNGRPNRRAGRTTSRSDVVGLTTGLSLKEMAAELAVNVGDVLGYIAEAEAVGSIRVDRTVVPFTYYMAMPPVRGRDRGN